MNLELNTEQKYYMATTLEDAMDMQFSASLAGEDVDIELKDIGSSCYQCPSEYSYAKRIRVTNQNGDLLLSIKYLNWYSISARVSGFEVTTSRPCTMEELGGLLDLIKAKKEALIKEAKEPAIKKVVKRALSTFSKFVPARKK